MQRLIILLGHPTYSLSVVLLHCWFPAGLGVISRRPEWAAARVADGALLLLLVVTGLVTPFFIRRLFLRRRRFDWVA